MKKEIEVDVATASQCSFIPFTPVPDEWRGMKVKIVPVIPETLTLTGDSDESVRTD